MKIIKIGQINFPEKHGKYIFLDLIGDLNKVSNVKYEYCNCLKNECDIVFYSIYDNIEKLNNVKGKPIFIYWTYEYMCPGPNQIYDNPFNFYKNNNLSISFYDDTDDNLFFPYFVLFIKNMIDVQGKIKKQFETKNKFCTFCASNESFYNANFRTNLVKYISLNYKEITCCGKVLNNTNNNYLPYNYEEAALYHNNYKFNICFENMESSNNLTYLTEKIIMAYMYNTVPIYWGASRVTEWFNKDSFVNCNGLTYEEILNKIKEIDNDNERYKYMLYQQPTIEDTFMLYISFIEKLDKFILNNINL